MIVKKNNPKKKTKNITKKILLIYFYSTVTAFMILTVLFFNTGIWLKYKTEINQRIHLNGIYNYKYAPHILKIIFTNMFSKIDTLYVDMDQKN